MSNLIPESLRSTRIIDKDHPINFATIIRADNVLDYIYTQKGDRFEGNGFDSSQLTNIAPPLDNMFIQFRWLNIDMGVLLQSKRVHSQGIEWLTSGSLWFPSTMQSRFGKFPTVSWSIPIYSDGHFDYIDNESDPRWDIYGSSIMAESEFSEFTNFLFYLIHAALFAINMMHCKNVIMEEQPLTSREKRMEKHGKPALRYHLLKVKTGHPIFGNGNGKRDTYSTHIVRGHFKTFTDAAPLMGKFVGTYWWDAQVRGRDKNHVVDKDYAIDIPTP